MAAQQAIASPVGLLQSVSLVDIVEEALSFHIGPKYQDKIAVLRNYEELEPVLVDRARLLQILFNLVSNAKDSTRDAGVDAPEIAVSISLISNSYQIAIRDNGLGIDASQQVRIFQHGFTTKDYGHGCGLHSSANAATEAGYKLTVHSDGIGHGATFKLCIPQETADQRGNEAAADLSPDLLLTN